jgi:hypothetical protein
MWSFRIKNFFNYYSLTFFFIYTICLKLIKMANLEINTVFLCIICGLLTLFFKRQFASISDNVKNTLIFNYIFFKKLYYKNYLLKFFYNYVEQLEKENEYLFLLCTLRGFFLVFL